jgi:YHS domain-containing protein
MKKILSILIAALILAACASNEKKSEEMKSSAPMVETAGEPVHYMPEMVVNKKDFSCGMPVSAGISDTCQIDGKAYGFCSSECKAEFMKDPKKYLSQK